MHEEEGQIGLTLTHLAVVIGRALNDGRGVGAIIPFGARLEGTERHIRAVVPLKSLPLNVDEDGDGLCRVATGGEEQVGLVRNEPIEITCCRIDLALHGDDEYSVSACMALCQGRFIVT